MSKSTGQLSDKEIVERFNSGDNSVFSVLVDRYLNKAYQIAYGILGNKQDAEEVSQDVFVRIYKALTKFRGDAEFSTWMYRIAVNLAKNKYRWNKSRGSKKNISIQASLGNDEGSFSLEDRISDESPLPYEKVELSEFEQNIMDEIEELPELYREALILRNVEEMSYEDIAKVLGCKLGTIKSRIARARDELRSRLGM
jgi:RNA polymerase sigma-70 factor (ECF subfamily)